MSTINGKACVANGRSLIVQSDLKTGYLNKDNGGLVGSDSDFHSDNYIATNGATVFTLSSPDYTFKGSINHTLVMYDSDKNYLGSQSLTSATQTLSKSNVAYIKFSINFKNEGGTAGNLSDWLNNHRYKLEKGTTATPWSPAPVDKVFSNGRKVYGRNLVSNSEGPINFVLGDGLKPQESWRPVYMPVTLGSLPEGDISISADVEIIGDFRFDYNQNNTIRFNLTSDRGNDNKSDNWSPNYDAGSWQTVKIDQTHFHMSITTKLLYDSTHQKSSSVRLVGVELGAYNSGLQGSGFILSRLKIESGIPTPWTPAPEDVM